MKGQLVSHTFAVGFNIILLLAIILSLNHISNEYKNFISSSESEQVCLMIKSAVTKLMPKTNYNTSSYMSGIIYTKLPERISNTKYRISIEGDLVKVHLLGIEKEFTCMLDRPVQSKGTTAGGTTKIKAIVNMSEIEIELSNI